MAQSSEIKLNKRFDQNIEITGTLTVGGNTVLTSFTETDPIFSASAASGITSTNITNWNTAYGWGDHATAGYLTSLPSHNHDALYIKRLGDVTITNFDTLPEGVAGSNETTATNQPYANHNITMTLYNDASAERRAQLFFGDEPGGGMRFRLKQGATIGWHPWEKVVTSSNIGDYALTSYSETSTLDAVADRGRSTNQQLISTNPAGFRVDSGSYARIELDSTNNWSYVRLQDQGVTTWDIACYDSGNLEWRPGGSSTNRMWLSQSGNLTIESGSIYFNTSTNSGRLYSDEWGVKVGTTNGYIQFGPANNSWAHIYTDRPAFYFNKELYVNNNLVFHYGNDGPGSGMNADLLDNLHATDFVQQLANTTSPNYTTPSSRRVDPNTSNPTNEHYAITTFGNNGNVTGQLATHFVSGLPYTRAYNNSWSAWRKIWTDANDGAGSGLDADRLDGLDSSEFLRSNTADTATGIITFNSDVIVLGDLKLNGTDSYIWTPASSTGYTGFWDQYNALSAARYQNNTKSWQFGDSVWINADNNAQYNGYNENIRLRAAGNGVSVIAFNAEGETGIPGSSSILGYSDRLEFRTNLGSNNSWQERIYNGYAEASGSYRAPVFYDSNNTGYYVNPASNSNFNTIDVASTANFQGDAAINGGSGWGAFKGYTSNWNHFISVRGSVSGATSSPSITGAHQTTLVEYAESNASTGWFFKSSNTGTYQEVAKITRDHSSFAGSVRSPIFYDSDDTGYYVDAANNSRMKVIGDEAGGALHIMYPNGASYGSGSVTGAFKITLPQSWTNTMMRMHIEIFNYSSNSSIDVYVSGYNYAGSGGLWANTSAYIVAPPYIDANYTVRFGHDGSKCCIYIGETNTSWSYPKVIVKSFQGGHSNYNFSQWRSGWTIAPTTSLASNIDATFNNIQVGRYTGILYDSDNTSYLVNPSSQSNLASLAVGSATVGDGVFSVRNGDMLIDRGRQIRWNTSTGSGEYIYSKTSSPYDVTIHSGAHDALQCPNTGQVRINYQGAQKFVTTSAGVSITGSMTASGDVIAYSDERVKENIETIPDALDKVKQLRGVSYNRTDLSDKSKKVGVIAQEIQKVLPEVVLEQEDGMLGVSYGNIVGVLIEAVKELSNKVEELENKLNGTEL